jgi:hypothetical protein
MHKITTEPLKPKDSLFLQGIFKFYIHFRTMKMRKRENVRLKILEEALDTFKFLYERAENSNNSESMIIFNVGLYTLTVERDVSALKFMILYQTDNWNKLYLSRQLAVLLYESTEDFLELLGKQFRKLMSDLKEKESLTLKLNEITKELNKFKSDNKEFLKEIRNYCGAHRDKNAYQQFSIINSVEPNLLLGLTAEFMAPIKKLSSFFIEVMDSIIDKSYSP